MALEDMTHRVMHLVRRAAVLLAAVAATGCPVAPVSRPPPPPPPPETSTHQPPPAPPAGARQEDSVTPERIGSVLRTRLDNGFTVVFERRTGAPVVALQLWVEVGSADEGPEESGLAHFIEHMLFKGDSDRAAGEMAAAIESAGGEINAWTSFDHTVLHVVLPADQLDRGLRVLAGAVRDPAWPAAEIEREQQVVIEEIKRNRDAPERWLSDLLFARAYRKHPYRRPVLGTARSVGGFDRARVRAFFRRHYRPSSMTLLAAGDLDAARLLAAVRRLFGPLQAPWRRRPARPPEPVQRKMRTHLVRDDIQEAHFGLAWHVPPVDHPDVAALDVLAVLLGQGDSSRLRLRLRHGAGVVNDIQADAYTPRDPGLFLVNGTCPPARMPRALRALAAELAALSHAPPSGGELAKAKTIIESDRTYERETVEGTARQLGYNQTLLGDPAHTDVYLGRVLSVSPEDVQRVARTYLTRQGLTLVALVPERKAPGLDEQALRRAVSAGWDQGARVAAAARPAAGRVTRVELEQGPVVIVEEDHANPLVSIRAAMLGGLRYEKPSNNGINNFLAGMLTRGTRSRSAAQIAEQMDAIAGTIDGFSGRNTLGLRADFPSRHLERGLEVFCDCLLHPTFPEDEIKRERELVLQAIRAREDHLPGLAFDLFTSALYPSHPYRMPLLGTRQSTILFRRKQLQRYLARVFSRDRLVIAVVGDVDTDDVVARLKNAFDKAPLRRIRPPTVPLDPGVTRPCRVTRRRARAQSHLVLGFRGTTLAGEDRHALDVLMAILTGQSGRLFVELRDRMSLAYAVSGVSLEGVEPGYLAFYLGVDPQRVDQAVRALEEQLARVRSRPVGKDELRRAQQYLVGIQEISMQRAAPRATALALNELYGLGHLAHRAYPERIRAVTAADVRRAARTYLAPDAACLAVVGPP